MGQRTEQDRVTFAGGVAYQILPDVAGDKLSIATATPSVSNRTHLIASNTAPITVTNFVKGAKYQTICILGDGQTTIANNANIVTNTGAAKLLAASKVYRFTLFGSIWYEDA